MKQNQDVQEENLEEICEEVMEEHQELFDTLSHEKKDDLYRDNR